MKPRFKKILLGGAVVLAIWNVVYFAGLRSWHQRWGASPAELTASLPGDVLFPDGTGQVTHAVTINAPPENIWPWLMQIGQDRSGFYSYTPLENAFGCEMPKVEKIVPEWPARQLGETVWFCTPKHYGASGKMIAAVVEPRQAFAMVMPGDWQQIQAGGHADGAMWEFALEPVGPQQTRLIARIRGGQAKTARARVAGLLFWEPAHFLMERRMLLTIKKLSERPS
jgi:hypothetical protein